MLSLAVFLGNPGVKYARNRHNAGLILAEKLPFYNDLSWKKKFNGRFAQSPVKPDDSALSEGSQKKFLIPETYMNLSGTSVQKCCIMYTIPPEKIIVVHDELELPLGFLSLKFGGGLGGHNGLRSVKQALCTADFWRLRIGIGRPSGRKPGEGGAPVKSAQEGGPGDIADWVLSDFNLSERPLLNQVLETGAGLLTLTLTEDPETLLPEWKKKSVSFMPENEENE